MDSAHTDRLLIGKPVLAMEVKRAAEEVSDPIGWQLAVMRPKAFRPCSFASRTFERFAMIIL